MTTTMNRLPVATWNPQGAGTEKLVLRSVGTTLPSQGSTVELLHALGLDAEGIVQAVREVLA